MSKLTAQVLELLYHEKDWTQKKIAEKFDVTQPWVSKKMKEYGIKSSYNGFWTEKEERILEENYKIAPKEELLSFLPNRNWESIKLKALKMGLSTPFEEHNKSDEVIERLKRNAKEREKNVDFENTPTLSYVLGVVDGDGFHDRKGSVGLETKSQKFADKFSGALESIGLNPGRGERRGKETVWVASKKFVEWLMDFTYESKVEWLEQSGDIWKYIEGAYDSDGDFSNSGPRICSYDENEKVFLKRILDIAGLEARIHSNNVYVPASSRERFFANVNPVYERRKP